MQKEHLRRYLEEIHNTNTKVSKENSTMVPCIYTNTTFCDAGEGVAAKVAAGRWFLLFTC